MAEFEKCGFYKSGKTSRGGNTVFWCLIAGADEGCFGYADGCPTGNFRPAREGPLRHRYPEPVRQVIERGTRQAIVLNMATSGSRP